MIRVRLETRSSVTPALSVNIRLLCRTTWELRLGMLGCWAAGHNKKVRDWFFKGDGSPLLYSCRYYEFLWISIDDGNLSAQFRFNATPPSFGRYHIALWEWLPDCRMTVYPFLAQGLKSPLEHAVWTLRRTSEHVPSRAFDSLADLRWSALRNPPDEACNRCWRWRGKIKVEWWYVHIGSCTAVSAPHLFLSVKLCLCSSSKFQPLMLNNRGNPPLILFIIEAMKVFVIAVFYDNRLSD